MSVNKAILIGNLGRDAEVKYTPGGKAVATFSIATTEKWKGADGQQNEKTEWHRIVLWGKVAEALGQYLVKGKQVYIEGRIQTRQWEKDGQKHYSTEINADQIKLLGGGSSSNRRNGSDPMRDGGGTSNVTDDDIPF